MLNTSNRIAIGLLCGALVLFAVGQASAQASFGAYGVRVSETVDGESAGRGVGLRAKVSFPLFPLSAYAAVERIFPNCVIEGCAVWAGEAGLNLAVFALPFVEPYVTAGVVRRRYDSGADDGVDNTEGISVGVGVSAGVPGIRAFLEGRYEFMDDPHDQFLLRLGVMF